MLRARDSGNVIATDPEAGGLPGAKKDLFSIWAANGPSYAATAIASEPLDLARKIERDATTRERFQRLLSPDLADSDKLVFPQI